MRFGFSVPLGQVAAGSEFTHRDPHRRQRSTATHHRTSKPIVDEPSNVLLEMKRALDVLGASLGLLILAPLLIGSAIAINRNRRFAAGSFAYEAACSLTALLVPPERPPISSTKGASGIAGATISA